MLKADSPEKQITIVTRLLKAGSSAQEAMPVTTRFESDVIEISILDTGPGIPENILVKLFKKPIERAEGGIGAGIGLMLTQTILQIYKGDIYVRPNDNKGAKIVIILPVEN
jgi:signal transduction histidine kinase